MHLAAAQASLDDQERIGYIADLMDDNGGWSTGTLVNSGYSRAT